MTRLLSHTIPALPLIRSLGSNTIGDKGALALATILNETKITQLRCVTAPECLPSYGCLNRRAPFLPSSLFDSSSLDLPASRTLPHSHPRDAAFELAPRRPDRTFSCQTGFPRIHLPRPFRSSSRRSLKNNGYISDQAKQAVRDAADSGVSIEF